MSKIEWTDRTINPIVGCSKISEGCANCYAKTLAGRLAGMAGQEQGKAGLSKYMAVKQWDGTTCFDAGVLDCPLPKKAQRIFVCSMSDLFHENNSFASILQVLAFMQQWPQHTFQILTKRPGRALLFQEHFPGRDIWPENLWFGISAENGEMLEERLNPVPLLRTTLNFISAEPFLGSFKESTLMEARKYISWVIVGGETGKNARKPPYEGIKLLSEFCGKNHIAYFFKKWGKAQNNENIKELERREFPQTVPFTY